MSELMKECPSCQCPYVYESGDNQYTCPECSFEWSLTEVEESDELIVIDANGVRLPSGDSVI